MNNENLLEKERDSISSIESLETGVLEKGLWSFAKFVESDEEEDEPEMSIKYKGSVRLYEGKMKFEICASVRKNYSSFLNKFFDGLIQLLKEKPALYQEFYPLINQEFENSSFHYDHITWGKLHARHVHAIAQYNQMVEELFSLYAYLPYSSEEAETREAYEMEFLEIFETMKLYCEAYCKELEDDPLNLKPNQFPRIQPEDYPRGISRAIPKEQLMLLPMFGGGVTLEEIDEVIGRIKRNQPGWSKIRKKMEESEKDLKDFCINEEIVQEYIRNLREGCVLNLALLEKFLVDIEDTPVYFWDPLEEDGLNKTALQLRREPTEILTTETFKAARHFVMGVGDNIFDIVDFNEIKICRKTPQKAQQNPFSFFENNNQTALRRKNSKNKIVHFWDEPVLSNPVKVLPDGLGQYSPKRGRF